MSIEVMKQALVALCSANPIGHALEDYEYHNKATEALRQAIEQAEYDKLTIKFGERAKAYLEEAKKSWEQEPVAWEKSYDIVCALLRQAHDILATTQYPIKRPWVGLTDEEIEVIAKRLVDDKTYFSLHFAIAIQAKLKEKNND